MSGTRAGTGIAAVRLRQVPVLLGPLASAVRWQPLLGAVGLAGLLLVLTAEDLDADGPAVLALRGVAALLALGAAFVLDDEAADTLASSPSTLAWRRSQRVVIVVALAGPAWALALLAVKWLGAEPPVAGLTLELAALLALSVACAAGIAHRGHPENSGVLATPLVVGIVLAAFRLPQKWALLVSPGPAWEAAHQRWAVLLTLSVAVVLLCNRDPAAADARHG